MNTVSRIPAGFLLLTTVCAACAPADEGDRGTAAVPHDVLVVTQTIGGADVTSPEYEFGQVAGLAPLTDARVAVVDRMNNVVRVFGADGGHLFSFGRAGEGPGEFRDPCCPAVDEDGRFWVRDGANSRYSAFDLHADSVSYAAQIRMSHFDANRWAPLTFDRDGNLIDIGSRTDRAAGVTRTWRMHLDSTGAIVSETAVHKVPDDSTSVRKVEREIPGGVATMFAYQPYGPSELAAHSPTGDYAHALSTRYAIEWRAADGSLIRTIMRDVPQGPALSTREDSAGEERRIQLAERLGVRPGQLGFDVPSHKAPLRALFFDQDGRLWVELEVADGSDRRADVYDTSGNLQRTVQWPSHVSLTDGASAGNVIWGVGRDSLDVATVVRLESGS
ncbi:MAG TPA: hypothetical protein VK912_20360 [Longimicrobiales bacterium]|nr:hypothetical protein [Longimicrobiales bacterium]